MSGGNKGLPAFNGENELDDYLCIGVRHCAPSFRVFPAKTYCSSGTTGTSDGPFYKHTAPLGQGDRDLGFLQTYCPLGQPDRKPRPSTYCPIGAATSSRELVMSLTLET